MCIVDRLGRILQQVSNMHLDRVSKHVAMAYAGHMHASVQSVAIFLMP